MRLIFDARALDLYAVGRPGFHGGTETYLKRVAAGLGHKGHMVHVVTPDLTHEEQRGPSEWWWPPTCFPTRADVVVMVQGLDNIEPYTADVLILAPNGVDPWIGDDEQMGGGIDGVACFTETHKRLLCDRRSSIAAEKCFVTGLGVDLADYPPNPEKRQRYLLWGNDPARGLWHLLDIFEHVRRELPDATLAISYDFERQFNVRKWHAMQLSEMLWDCRRRIGSLPGVLSLGELPREEMIREQLACEMHVMPSDPPNIGSQVHGMMQMECAAASCALVLSETEALPELFKGCAEMLPVPGWFRPELDRRLDAQDWAAVVVDILQTPTKLMEMGSAARRVAEQHTWGRVVERWEAMLAILC